MKLTIYMKSGNKIVLRFIKAYQVQKVENRIVGLTITRTQFWPGQRLMVKTIDLSQIEAITQSGDRSRAWDQHTN